MNKKFAKELQESYCPQGGQLISMKDFSVLRKIPIEYLARCGFKTCDDIQSGPIYCGRVADYLIVLRHKTTGRETEVYVCSAHKNIEVPKLKIPKWYYRYVANYGLFE